VFRLAVFFSTEEFTDSQPASSLLVYYGGILGFAARGTHFQPARNYAPYLSALIHQQRLLFLEYTLPCRPYPDLLWEARPQRGHLRRLNKVRRRFMCAGCLTPRRRVHQPQDYGRKIARTDGHTFLVHWSDDGQTLFYLIYRLHLGQFRDFARWLLDTVETSCRYLMYD